MGYLGHIVNLRSTNNSIYNRAIVHCSRPAGDQQCIAVVVSLGELAFIDLPGQVISPYLCHWPVVSPLRAGRD